MKYGRVCFCQFILPVAYRSLWKLLPSIIWVSFVHSHQLCFHALHYTLTYCYSVYSYGIINSGINLVARNVYIKTQKNKFLTVQQTHVAKTWMFFRWNIWLLCRVTINYLEKLCHLSKHVSDVFELQLFTKLWMVLLMKVFGACGRSTLQLTGNQ